MADTLKKNPLKQVLILQIQSYLEAKLAKADPQFITCFVITDADAGGPGFTPPQLARIILQQAWAFFDAHEDKDDLLSTEKWRTRVKALCKAAGIPEKFDIFHSDNHSKWSFEIPEGGQIQFSRLCSYMQNGAEKKPSEVRIDLQRAVEQVLDNAGRLKLDLEMREALEALLQILESGHAVLSKNSLKTATLQLLLASADGDSPSTMKKATKKAMEDARGDCKGTEDLLRAALLAIFQHVKNDVPDLVTIANATGGAIANEDASSLPSFNTFQMPMGDIVVAFSPGLHDFMRMVERFTQVICVVLAPPSVIEAEEDPMDVDVDEDSMEVDVEANPVEVDEDEDEDEDGEGEGLSGFLEFLRNYLRAATNYFSRSENGPCTAEGICELTQFLLKPSGEPAIDMLAACLLFFFATNRTESVEVVVPLEFGAWARNKDSEPVAPHPIAPGLFLSVCTQIFNLEVASLFSVFQINSTGRSAKTLATLSPLLGALNWEVWVCILAAINPDELEEVEQSPSNPRLEHDLIMARLKFAFAKLSGQNPVLAALVFVLASIVETLSEQQMSAAEPQDDFLVCLKNNDIDALHWYLRSFAIEAALTVFMQRIANTTENGLADVIFDPNPGRLTDEVGPLLQGIFTAQNYLVVGNCHRTLYCPPPSEAFGPKPVWALSQMRGGGGSSLSEAQVHVSIPQHIQGPLFKLLYPIPPFHGPFCPFDNGALRRRLDHAASLIEPLDEQRDNKRKSPESDPESDPESNPESDSDSESDFEYVPPPKKTRVERIQEKMTLDFNRRLMRRLKRIEKRVKRAKMERRKRKRTRTRTTTMTTVIVVEKEG